MNKKLDIVVISNIIFQPHFELLMNSYFGRDIKIYSIPYEEYYSNNYKHQIETADMIIIWLNFEAMLPDITKLIYSRIKTEQKIKNEIYELCVKLYVHIIENTNSRILWFLFEDYYAKSFVATGHSLIFNGLIDKINTKLYTILNTNVYFIDLKALIAEVGIRITFDLKGKYRWNAPYSRILIEAAVKEIHKKYMIEKGITKKCIIIDCDNVLWGGILSEEGIESIKLSSNGLGQVFKDFQRFLLFLYYHGIILTVCSKNDASDVMFMFRNHSEMILKEEHIACFQINWDNKPDNIKKIAETLNIGFDSMVFIDDSHIEIEAVKAMLPEVIAVLFEQHTIYEQLSCFNLKSNVNIKEIEKRHETYRTNQSRNVLKAEFDNYNEYIEALHIKVDIHLATPIEFSRISELTLRTNKCTNGKRYTIVEIKERIKNNNVKLYSITLSDRFSDLGLVGALEVEDDTITLFSLSCRALGVGIEEKMLEFIVDKHKIKKSEFFSTGKNGDLESLLQKTLSIFNI